nr:type IV secretory system conjugative DNA transfer family protein [Jiella avicenniae]
MFKPGGLFLGEWRGLFGLVRRDLYHHGEAQILTLASPGSGKSAGLVVPNLLTDQPGSFVVNDPSGELTAITRRFRATRGPVVILNPYAGDFTASEQWANLLDDTGFNPLSLIDTGPHLAAECADMARLLMVTINRDQGDYFDIDSVQFLSLVLVHMMLNFPEKERTLGQLFLFVHRTPDEIEKSLVKMVKAGQPQIVPRAKKFLGIQADAPEQWAGVIARVQQAAATYEPLTPLGEHVAKSGFDAADLTRHDMTVYLVCPSQHLRTAQPWLNLMIGALGMAVGRPGPARSVTFLVDEAPALGLLPDLRDMIGQFRKAGLRVWLFSQTRAAFDSIYGRESAAALLGLATITQFFGITEWSVAKDASEMMGETSRANRGLSEGDKTDRDSFSSVGVPLLRPEEIYRAKRGRMVLSIAGIPHPIQARLVPYFKRRTMRKRADLNPYRGR